MTLSYAIVLVALLLVLAVASYIDRIYSEMGKFLAREYQDNIDSWEEVVEPRLRLGRESIALSGSVLRQLSLGGIALTLGLRLAPTTQFGELPHWPDVARTVFEVVLLTMLFDRLIPQLLFTRTRGLWAAKLTWPIRGLLYLISPVTLALSLLLSIASLANPETSEEPEHPSEAMEALLEAGEEEGIFEESDRELVRSVVEFGDKVVREVMTPRPQMFAVPGSLTLEEFTAQIEEHVFSRVPVFSGTLDQITGIVFAHDLLQILDTDAGKRTVAQLQRPAAFVPETKKVAELLKEMQREKQHMRIVIDEYGGVAGLVTIEDLLEAIVGSISDEHDEGEADDEPVREEDGTYVVSGSFEVSRLRELFEEPKEHKDQREQKDASRTAEDGEPHEPEDDEFLADDESEEEDEAPALRLSQDYESTTLGGLVSEIAGHIPLPGEVVEEDGLRLEVLASTDRRIDRIRVSLAGGAPDGDGARV
ncbi:hemolysin family protein [Granulicella sibirica]|uniref:Magnesium and cobalt efflux protein CorC n=1 Tax=Granulicella sibirica TaxID=2479048 RepID=A0A4Q0T1I1_9BACT|nr:hemolysin family protein [Granulicella sibirica]RXH57495.1 Magnesium and cobalt efflux protein CorC [Granulicella sibirica]